MHSLRPTRSALAAALVGLGLVLASPAGAQAQEPPSDSATMRVEYQQNQDIEAAAILASWGKKFGALVVVDPQIQPIRIKFLTTVNSDLTWAAVKAILDFNDIVIVESQPAPGGPFVIRAHHRRNINQKEGPPWRYVPGEDVPDFDELVTAVFQIKHGAGNSIFATVRGLLTRDTNRIGNILYVQGPEVIIIVDLASKVRYYARVIEALDVAGPRKLMKSFQVNFAPVQELANILTTVLQQLAGQQGGQPGQPVVVSPGGNAAGTATVLADARTNKLVVVAFPIDMPLVEDVIQELDVRVAAPTGRFHVYPCKDADAQDLAGKIQELFTGQKAPTKSSSNTNQPGTSGSVGTSGGSGVSAVSIEGTAGGVGEVETRIVADERTNSLLIQAEERHYREILQVLNELDKKRRRVLIEAEVWEISKPTDSIQIGFELAALTNAHEDSTRPIAATGYGLSQLVPKTNANGDTIGIGRNPLGSGSLAPGITAVLTRDTFDKLPVIMQAIANFEEARLVTKPFAVTNDNTPSTFTLSNRQPFLTTTVNNVASQQNVQFVDANSTLTIEPQVNSEDNLTLKLTLEISSFSGSGSVNLPPGTNSRKYEGEVTVPNGRYVVFGGLEQETERFVENKVPFLGDIPILGHLFKNWNRSKTKTKVYIFVRPTIFEQNSFSGEARLGSHLREKIHYESAREEWLPPVVPDRFMQGPGYDLQDEAFDTFGTGSGDPFRGGAVVGPPEDE
jgi:general secretion pathway protein D